jgi:cytoskeleton protein RodZ
VATEEGRESSSDEIRADEGTAVEEDTSPQEPAIEQEQEVAEASAESNGESASQEESAQTTEAASDPLPDSELVLSFDDECWIRIEDSTGQAIAFGVKMPGQVVALDGEAPYQVTLGSPESVRLVFRGEDVDLSAYRSGRVARIDLPRTE